MKKTVMIIILIIVLLIILWLGMFLTDYVRCSNFEEPLFAKATFSTDLGYSDGRKDLAYKGVGYNISTNYIQTAESEKLISVYMYIFNKKILSKDKEIKDVIIDNVNIENSKDNMAETKEAVIIEVNNTTLSVIDVKNKEDIYVVTIPKGENLKFKQGQEILIHYNGNIIYTFPRQIVNVGRIEIIKEVSDIEIPIGILRYFYSEKEKVSVSLDALNDAGIVMTVTDTNKIPYEYDKSVNFFYNFEYTGEIVEPQNIQVSGYIISSYDNEKVEEVKAEELEEIKNKEEKETITKIVYTWGKGEEKFRKGTYDFYVNTTNLENFTIRVIFQVDESGNIELESVNI